MSVDAPASPVTQHLAAGLLRCAAAGVAVGLAASAVMVALILALAPA